MQLEQQETFEIKSPQLEVFGQVESKLPAPAKKRPFAAGFLAVMVLVSVFGIGGVGGYTVEALARSGVGALDLIDDDKVCLTNLTSARSCPMKRSFFPG